MKTYIPMSESTIYADLKKAYEKVDWHEAAFTVAMTYDKWWHRFIPSKRREIKARKKLVESIINQKEFAEKTLEKMNHVHLYGNFEDLKK